ncbi:hypothetical protein [Microvirga calopogonii]|nr:hypothetical protein [Microvirga calopogonii]
MPIAAAYARESTQRQTEVPGAVAWTSQHGVCCISGLTNRKHVL